MPIVAKLSNQFYERLGDAATTELVEWMNAVILQSQEQIRELNELNFARFRAEMHAELSQFETRIHASFTAQLVDIRTQIGRLEMGMEHRLNLQDEKIERRFAEQDAKFEKRWNALETKLAWQMLANLMSVIGVVIALWRSH